MSAPPSLATPLLRSSGASKPIAPTHDVSPQSWIGRVVTYDKEKADRCPCRCGIFVGGYVFLAFALIGSTYFRNVPFTATVGAVFVVWVVFHCIDLGCYLRVTRGDAQKSSTPEEHL